MSGVLGKKSVMQDLLSAKMSIVEQITNARHLVPGSSDIDDNETLTVNPFLLGKKNTWYHIDHG